MRVKLFPSVIIILLLTFLFSGISVFAEELVGDGGSEAKGLVGLYDNGSERFFIRERDERIELLYDVETGGDIAFKDYTANPLLSIGIDTYRLLSYGPLSKEMATVTFSRNKDGRGVACQIGEKTFQRNFYDPEKGLTFRIKPLLPLEELQKEARRVMPPVENGMFRPSDLVEVVKLDSTIQLDILYATANNFMGIPLYDEPRAFLQRPAAQALVAVQRQLQKYGYGLIIYDAYRPWYVTKMFWEATPDKQKGFVADPQKGSRHNRGGAVDVGLYELKNGKPVMMISGYDEFSIRAYPTYPGGTTVERWQRDLLRTIMQGEGFTVYPEEWWHFDYSEWQYYPIQNLRFNEI